MTTPHLSTPGLQPKAAPPKPGLGLVDPPSFARALRKRGLLLRPETTVQSAFAAADTPDQWQSVVSLFEAHLKRQAMEQAFASLRGD